MLGVSVHACRSLLVPTSVCPGLEPFMPGESIQARATQLTESVLRSCNLALMLFDGR